MVIDDDIVLRSCCENEDCPTRGGLADLPNDYWRTVLLIDLLEKHPGAAGLIDVETRRCPTCRVALCRKCWEHHDPLHFGDYGEALGRPPGFDLTAAALGYDPFGVDREILAQARETCPRCGRRFSAHGADGNMCNGPYPPEPGSEYT